MLQVEMPGVNKDGLEISVENNELTIIGRRFLPAVEGTLIHRESRRENYRHAFELDPSIDADKINAKIDQGRRDFDSAQSGAGQATENQSFLIDEFLLAIEAADRRFAAFSFSCGRRRAFVLGEL